MVGVWQRIRAGLRDELAPMFRVAWPVATSELGWMMMGLVDTMVVGRVSAEAIGAVSIGGHVFFTVAILGMGMLLGLDYLVAHAVGARRHADARRALAHALYLSLVLGVVLTGVVLALAERLAVFGIQPEIARATPPYLRALSWSMLPLLLYTSLRRYLTAVGAARAVMVALITANLVNLAVNWILVFGHLGAPALGAEGSGWATTAARVYLLLFAGIYAIWHERRFGVSLRLHWAFDADRLRTLLRLGGPAALQMVLEVGVFAMATLLAGRLAATQLAAHQVALSAAAFAFMVPLGISSAAAVRVGYAMGRVDSAGATRSGWTALFLGVAFMSCSATLFVAAPRWIIGIFTTDAAVADTAVSLLAIAALFQLFDGLQVVATGVLRGAGDTRSPMLASLVSYWLIGLPVGYVMCFRQGLGVVGLWIGLCIGLIAVAIALIAIWSLRSRELQREHRLVAPASRRRFGSSAG